MKDLSKAVKYISAVFLTACILLCGPLFLTSYASNAQFDSTFQNNPNWVDSDVNTVNTMYNRGDKFIIFYFRPDACYNSYYVATHSLELWMDCGTKVYGLNCDLNNTYSASWLYNQVKGGGTLPYVLFVDNKSVSTYKATDYSYMSEMVGDLNQKYTSFTGNILDTSTLKSSNLTFSVIYHQTEARTILSKINALRTGGNAWYWSADDSEKVYCSGLTGLTYDYNLEKAAMQRAAELAVQFAHTRPNGESCLTAYQGRFMGENIAYGQKSAEEVQTAWEEVNEKYEGQGHRRNILSSGYTAVGIACAEYNGVKFWVQEFRDPVISTSQTSANDSASSVTVAVLDRLIASRTPVPSFDTASLNVGDTVPLPAVEEQITIAVTPNNTFCSAQSCSWSSSNTAVASISSGSIKAVGAGTAMLTGTCAAGAVKVNVSVSGGSVTPTAYTLTYNANGGTGAPASQTGNGNITLSSSKPTRSDYTFKGWATSSGASSAQYQPGASFNLTKNTTLYAVWEKETVYKCAYCGLTFATQEARDVHINDVHKTSSSYTLSYNANGGTGAPASQTGNGNITLSRTKPSRSGYMFLGWSTSSSASSAQYQPGAAFNLTKNTTLYAVWESDPGALTDYTLTYNANGGTGAPPSQTSSNGLVTLSSLKPSRSGYEFLGWALEQNATEAKFKPGATCTINGNATLYAIWKYNPTAKAEIRVRSSATVSYRSRVKITATARNVPEEYQLVICDGLTPLARGDNKSVTYDAGEMTSNRTFTVYVVEKGGTAIQKNSDGLLEKNCEITVTSGFFAKMLAFFKSLLGALPNIEVKP